LTVSILEGTARGHRSPPWSPLTLVGMGTSAAPQVTLDPWDGMDVRSGSHQ
jgi:hypothetical protein